jgi:hypothetical protein
MNVSTLPINIKISQGGTQGPPADTTSLVSQKSILRFKTSLQSGISTQFIEYPRLLENPPNIINCEFHNRITDSYYECLVNNVNNVGFNINFSDIIDSTGYFVSSIVWL